MSVQIIKHEGGLYTLYAKQTVAKERDVLWDFFRKPRNLNKLTPEDVEFKIISGKVDHSVDIAEKMKRILKLNNI